MTTLLIVIGAVLAASLALGVAVGRWAGLPPRRSARLAAAALIALAAGSSGLALIGLVPGRTGLWIETGALILDAYLLGAIAGALLARARRPRAGRGGLTAPRAPGRPR